ncbi:MAG TPA: class I SAM-dependent methyltransferase [Bacteriovoracaceae bacterium]|nr:class I SAM-dependent methyltransferase [Bacteriovoracaceae bacterium]
MKNSLTLDQKYDYYERSVQNAECEVSFMHDEYKRAIGRSPLSMREDFCGTGAISCEWVKQNKDCQAWGVDLDPEPIKMGKKRHHSKLGKSEKERMQYLEENVLKVSAPKVDVVCAFNFSYFIFKSRKEMVKYCKSVRKSLKKDGVFFLDIFGGPESQKLVTDTKKLKGLTYYWECQRWNPLTHDCLFAIHFKDSQGKHLNAFTYDWRMWTLPELRDILLEAGFKKTVMYWEGDDEDGNGNGEFSAATEVENCDAWVSYIGAMV